MKVAFYSNFLNHHQLPLCFALDRLTNGQFTFVATTPVPQERLFMGYHDMNKAYPFVLTTYDSDENQKAAMELAINSDIVITGSAPEIYTQVRAEANKITFRYSERIYKRGLWCVFSPRGVRAMLKHHRKYNNKPVHMLCASAYTAFDYSLTGAYRNKTYKWGYFPEVKKQNIEELIAWKRRNDRVHLLWVGRMLKWKHPETAIEVAERLKKAGIEFELKFIGNGALESQVARWIEEKNLVDCVYMLGAMTPEQVREYMEEADIFLFTSDFNEGWGAVLNESMNSGCAVVASHAIGSVPFLIADGKNGFIYRNGDTNSLYERVLKLIDDSELRERMGRNAYQTLDEQWNADAAAERLLMLSQAMLDNKTTDLFSDGPCSRAENLRNGWYRG